MTTQVFRALIDRRGRTFIVPLRTLEQAPDRVLTSAGSMSFEGEYIPRVVTREEVGDELARAGALLALEPDPVDELHD